MAVISVLIVPVLVQTSSSLPVDKKPQILSGPFCVRRDSWTWKTWLNHRPWRWPSRLILAPCLSDSSIKSPTAFVRRKIKEGGQKVFLEGNKAVGTNIQGAKVIPKQLVMCCVFIFGDSRSAWWTDSVCCPTKQNLFQLWDLWGVPSGARCCFFPLSLAAPYVLSFHKKKQQLFLKNLSVHGNQPLGSWGPGEGADMLTSVWKGQSTEINILIRACGSSDYSVLRLCQCWQHHPN